MPYERENIDLGVPVFPPDKTEGDVPSGCKVIAAVLMLFFIAVFILGLKELYNLIEILWNSFGTRLTFPRL